MAPSLQYATKCYPPEQVRQAERLLPVPPIDPSRAVGKFTGLWLAQVIAANRLLPKLSRRVVLLEFDYGTFPAGSAGIPDPSPPLPKWVVVEEFAAPFKGLKGVRVEQSTGPEGPPGSVPVWTLEENLPRHSLGVEILTNEDQVTIRHVGRELIREANRSIPYKWNPAKEACVPEPRLAFPHQRHWLLYFDGLYPSRPHQVRHLGISSPLGSPIRRATVIVVVPSGSEFSGTEKVSSDVAHYLKWPTDFPGAPKTQPIGIYTVIWRTGVYSIIGCAGFVVRKVAFVASGSHNSRRLLNDPFLAKWIKRAAPARAGGSGPSPVVRG